MKSALFLMEQLIAIFTFTLCAAVCIKIFTASYTLSGNSRDINNAIFIAECGAEGYKAVNGNFEKAALILSGNIEGADNAIYVYYNASLQTCKMDEAVYILKITRDFSQASASLQVGNISVQKTRGDEIITFSVAARRKT